MPLGASAAVVKTHVSEVTVARTHSSLKYSAPLSEIMLCV